MAVLGTGTLRPMPTEKLICRGCILLLSSYLNSHPKVCILLGNPAEGNNHIKPNEFVWRQIWGFKNPPFFKMGPQTETGDPSCLSGPLSSGTKYWAPRLLCPISLSFHKNLHLLPSSRGPHHAASSSISPSPPHMVVYIIYLPCPISSIGLGGWPVALCWPPRALETV